MLDSVKLLVVRSRECYESLQRYAKCISLFIPLPLFRNFKKMVLRITRSAIFLPATAVLVTSLKMYFYLKHVPRLHHQAQLAATTNLHLCIYF